MDEIEIRGRKQFLEPEAISIGVDRRQIHSQLKLLETTEQRRGPDNNLIDQLGVLYGHIKTDLFFHYVG
jgi:hypothetical protein